MAGNIFGILKKPLIFMLVLSLLPIIQVDTSARKKERVRKQAIETIRTTSDEIAELAGIEPALPEFHDSSRVAVTKEKLQQEGEIIEELEKEDDVSVDLETFKTLWLTFVTDGEYNAYTSIGVKKSDIMDEIMEWLGTRYRYGGTTSRGIDCSAFVRMLYLKTGEILIPRTARVQWNIGATISRSDLEFGDLVFFHTRRRYYVSHVGIYLGDNLFAHSSSRYGVTVSSLESGYYDKRFIGARRLTPRDVAKFNINKDDEQGESSKQ